MSHKQPGFLRQLFHGHLDAAALLPFPWPDEATRETTETVTSMVRDWAAENIDPVAIDRDKEIGASVLSGMAELGLFGLTIPEEYGGAGLGQWTYAHVMEALAHRCASTVTVLGGHLGIGMKGLLLYGTAAQKERWFPDLASGKRIAAFALTEAGAGSDAAALRTTARRTADGSWKLDGSKVWITNGGFAGFFTLFARTPVPEQPDAPVSEWPISAFIVPREAAGVTTGVPEDKMGLRGSSTTEVGLEGVVLPADSLLGPEGEGFKVALNILNSGRHGLSACCLGQAKLARDLAAKHAVEREQFGQPIGRFGMVQELIAGMEADIYVMEAGTWLSAGLMDREPGADMMLEAACCKTFATEALWRICNDALQVTGGTGFMREYPYERILRDARINMIFEGTNQVLRMMLTTQGLRQLVRDPEIDPPPQTGGLTFEGLHPDLTEERATFEALAPELTRLARESARRHGKAFRNAQHEQHRLADMAIALFSMAAVLSRASSGARELEAGERATVALACRRLERDFTAALRGSENPFDGLVDEVANRRLGL